MGEALSVNCTRPTLRRAVSKGIVWGFCVILLFSCTQKPLENAGETVEFVRLGPGELPRFEDDLDSQSLKAALEKSLSFYGRVPGDRIYNLGPIQVRADKLKNSISLFLTLLEANRLDSQSISSAFDVYEVRAKTAGDPILVTGYYEPILEGRLEQGPDFCYPIYGLPSDLLTIELAAFDHQRYTTERLIGRLDGRRVVPYYTRREIDGQKKLEKSQNQLVWLKDPVDAFFLHVQGSGMIHLPGGKDRRLGYAGANGRAYRSIGKYLIERNAIPAEDVSLQSIRAYLRAHPEVVDEVLSYNESYVFFRWVDDGPLGSLNVPLTTGRSIATDPKYYPRGAMAFLETQKPLVDSNGEVTRWEPLRRWVLNQDVGGAIKGMGRVDLFCGTGETAEHVAGRLKHPGRIYVLLMKEKVGE